MKNKVVLVICDGLGYREAKDHNAVLAAHTPNLDNFKANFPFALLEASGEAIGLPEGQMGTSEANHLVIGSGRVIYQNLVKINKAAQNKELETNPAILEAFEHVKKYNSALHIKGMVSDGGVHGHIEHLKALVLAAKVHGVNKIFLHLFTDGRDVAPQSAKNYIHDLEGFLENTGVGKIASLGGRYWGMDRDNNHERVEKHFLVMTRGSEQKFKTALDLIEHNYQQGKSDEFIEPASIELEEEGEGLIAASDAVVFANFRSDRARQITKRIVAEKIDNLKYVAMTKYDDELDVRVAFGPEEINNFLSQVVSVSGKKQIKITETEKFTHLTFFFNAQQYEPMSGEERIMIPSNKDVATHDEKPEMKAKEIAQAVVDAIQSDQYDFIAVNLTNCDMVGHSGNFPAIVKAVEAVDSALGQIAQSAQEQGYTLMITADHGNAEETFDPKINQAITSHTLNPVPFYFISPKYAKIKREQGDLSDVAPTILKIMDLDIPAEMTGKSFI
jgi:2,3-bisphosphoglycerate-independent phosphoglycerate mutase